jgi:septum formation protein
MLGFWKGKAPLLLASKSAARQALLAAARIPFETMASVIDERLVEAPLLEQGAPAAEIAATLAQAKAHSISVLRRDRLVLGADQTLSFNDRTFSKPATIAEARAQIEGFSGRTHELHSALCLMRDGSTLFETVVTARLTCRTFTRRFVDRYMEAAGDDVLASVGAYQVEGLGVHLFERIEGDHATILGLPLLPLLVFLRSEGSLVG